VLEIPSAEVIEKAKILCPAFGSERMISIAYQLGAILIYILISSHMAISPKIDINSEINSQPAIGNLEKLAMITKLSNN
jgi:hypothetical protein